MNEKIEINTLITKHENKCKGCRFEMIDVEDPLWEYGSPLKRVLIDNQTGETYDGVSKLVVLLNEQQATIDKQELRLQCLEEILELSENLNKSYREKLIDMNLKMMIDDEPFEFNKNCAKPYEIRSVSPNGVIRLGKKNYKAKWRMKDVREINNELPTREEFNRETYQKLRNKYHTKHWCGDDVLGRIIYNIYIGTFEEYI